MAKQLVETKQPDADVGKAEYRHVVCKAGQKFEAVLMVDGVEKGRLGPWVAKAKSNHSAMVQVRLIVTDQGDISDFTPKPVELEP